MSYLEKDYGAGRVRQMERRKRIQQIILLVSLVSFAGSTVFGLGKLFMGQKQQQQSSRPGPVSQESLLTTQERGYERVLQREPNNQTALEGLANVRIQMGNSKGAVEPLEKLVKLYPDRTDYKEMLGESKGPGTQPTEP